MGQIFGAFRGMQDGPLGRAARGGGAPLVKTGEYLVTFVYGDDRQKQVLRVERIGGLTGVSGFGQEGDDEEAEQFDALVVPAGSRVVTAPARR